MYLEYLYHQGGVGSVLMVSYQRAVEFVQPTTSRYTQDFDVKAILWIPSTASDVLVSSIHDIHD